MFDLTDVTFVKRITVGSDDPNRIKPEAEIQESVDLLNKCLSTTPKGTLLGMEKGFSVLNVGEHQVVLQCMVYHVGFVRKPYWLE
jgi:hypothetical protein